MTTALLIAVVIEGRAGVELLAQLAWHPGEHPSFWWGTVGRVIILIVALWALAAALMGSLVFASPVGYPGVIAASLGVVVTLGSTVVGVIGLLYITRSRILQAWHDD